MYLLKLNSEIEIISRKNYISLSRDKKFLHHVIAVEYKNCKRKALMAFPLMQKPESTYTDGFSPILQIMGVDKTRSIQLKQLQKSSYSKIPDERKIYEMYNEQYKSANYEYEVNYFLYFTVPLGAGVIVFAFVNSINIYARSSLANALVVKDEVFKQKPYNEELIIGSLNSKNAEQYTSEFYYDDSPFVKPLLPYFRRFDLGNLNLNHEIESDDLFNPDELSIINHTTSQNYGKSKALDYHSFNQIL